MRGAPSLTALAHCLSILKGSAILEPDQWDVFQTLPLFPCETGSGTTQLHAMSESKSSPISSDYERAEKFISEEKRTVAQKYYATEVHAMIEKHSSLQRKSRQTASQFVEETLLSVSLAHEVRRRALILVQV